MSVLADVLVIGIVCSIGLVLMLGIYELQEWWHRRQERKQIRIWCGEKRVARATKR